MELQFFLNWYSKLDLAPITSEFLSTCAREKKCHDCKNRVNCPIRPMFYMDDNDFEMNLQISEIRTQQIMSGNSPMSDMDLNTEHYSFISTEKIRSKRDQEIKEYPEYSEL